MNKKLKRAVKKYMQDTRRLISCPKGERKRFAMDMENDIACFIKEHNPADISAIISYFGTPDELSQTYLEHVPFEVITSCRQRKRSRCILLTATAIAAFLIGILFTLYTLPRELDAVYAENPPIEIQKERIH